MPTIGIPFIANSINCMFETNREDHLEFLSSQQSFHQPF